MLGAFIPDWIQAGWNRGRGEQDPAEAAGRREQERLTAFYARPPAEPCHQCRNNRWQAKLADTGHPIGWRCSQCGQAPRTAAEWEAEQAADASAKAAREAEIAAASTPAATRAALVAAFDRRRAAEAELARLREAESKIETMVLDALRAQEAAAAAVRRSTGAGGVLAEALGDQSEAGKSGRQLRADLEAADERLSECRTARVEIKRQVAAVAGSLDLAADRLRSAAVEAIRAHSAPTLAAFIAETERMQAQLAARGWALEWLTKAGILDRETGTGPTARRFNEPPRDWKLPAEDLTGRWRALLDGLVADPKAAAKL